MDWLLVRMAKWVHQPPSRRFIIAATAVVIIAAVLYTVERAGYWPDWARADRMGRRGAGIHATPIGD
ncbi:hypothetical protein [Acuticoccus mangrovi]|uniref:Uncharacterized protein n=1 Tax=Acuticoccus mangrovi TaxID=2796142 RepID=A0A934IRA0_9HYPH|nr:hypothetical protein [Acuticoccus mangrovi]MBJ3777276.1 hypothetical protein [Acuticoccus mangrovi]